MHPEIAANLADLLAQIATPLMVEGHPSGARLSSVIDDLRTVARLGRKVEEIQDRRDDGGADLDDLHLAISDRNEALGRLRQHPIGGADAEA